MAVGSTERAQRVIMSSLARQATAGRMGECSRMSPDVERCTNAAETFDAWISLTEARDCEADLLVEADGISVCLGLDPPRVSQRGFNHRSSNPGKAMRPFNAE